MSNNIPLPLEPVQDNSAKCISIDPVSGLVRVDGIPMFKVIDGKDGIKLQFKDGDKLRSKYRGTQYIEVPLEALVNKIKAELS